MLVSFLDRGEFGYQFYALADNGSVVGPMLSRKITIDTLVAHTKGQRLVLYSPQCHPVSIFLSTHCVRFGNDYHSYNAYTTLRHGVIDRWNKLG